MKVYLTSFLLLLHLSINAQFLTNDEIFKRTAKQSVICPPEKVYLHTDRNNYVAGEKIWMRAHVADGIAHIPMKLSQFVYVTLQNPFLETIKTVRLHADKDGFIHGNLPLPTDLPKGEYILTAYTRYQENFEDEYFFRKRIFIHSILNNCIQSKMTWEENGLNIHFFNPQTNEILSLKECTAKTQSQQFHLYAQNNKFRVRKYTKDSYVLIQTGNYQEFISLRKGMDYDVSFMPEGGNLINDAFCRVAFKSINEMGLGEDITGTLRDEQDSILLHFKSYYKGMGIISYFPKKGKKYAVVCENEQGITKRFNLPDPEGNYTMQVNQINEKIFVKVLFDPNIVNDESLLVFAHQRGWPVKVGKWSKKTPGLVCQEEDFLDGIASFLLINEKGYIVGERMIFIQRGEQIKTGAIKLLSQSDSTHRINLQMQVSEKWWKGDCSVSITDNKDVKTDSCNNLLTHLLLTSDLKGHIESPAWYFKNGDEDLKKLQRMALEALMMTQGWRKYDFRKGWAANYKEPNPIPEQWQELSGKVTSRTSNSPMEKAVVRLMIPDVGIIKDRKTDKEGKFSFVNVDMPDSTRYWFTAHSHKNKTNVILELDSIVYPKLKYQLPPNRLSEISNQEQSDYLSKVNLKLLNETGIRHMHINEIVVTAPKVTQGTEYEKILGSTSIKEDEIARTGIQHIITFLRQKIPALTIMQKEYQKGTHYDVLAIRGETVAIVLDGAFLNPLMIDPSESEQALQLINTLRMEDIHQIDVIKGAQAIGFHTKATGGLIAITTKSGNTSNNAKHIATNIKSLVPLGFQKPTSFYSPRYEAMTEKENSLSDYRTTIHWDPRLKVKKGKANIVFFATDKDMDYSIVIEGIGENGSLLRIEERIK